MKRPMPGLKRGPMPVLKPALFAAFACLLIAAFRPDAAAAHELPTAVREALRTAGVADGEFAVLVRPLDGGPALASHNAGIAYNPASAMKLVTTYAALALLGPEYRWKTTVSVRGRMVEDVLHGDLVLRGGGDPKLVIEDLVELVARLRAAGLREILGNLVVDDSLYDVSGESASLDGQLSQPYNVSPHAALMNFKSTKFVVRPAKEAVAITMDPPLAGVRLVNAVKLVPGRCRNGAWGLSITDGVGQPPSQVPEIRVSGTYSAGCGQQATMAAVLDHKRFIEAFFRSAWQSAGGSWSGRAVDLRSAAEGAATARSEPLVQWTSPRTLGDVVKDINKLSNNVMARQVMLQTAVERAPGQAATPERARRVVGDWLRGRGLWFPEMVIDNGSGLSRNERISADSLVRLLVDVGLSEYRAAFVDSLPVAGIDGTMKYRLVSDPIAGQARIKTGSLEGVRSIAGYVNAASGKRYAVVMIVNSPRAGASRATQDHLLRWVHASG
jgi:serine-type D-Ala-D-Ala carboxypeptidase/endopeptidase (penicillin-binding protein 4)